MTKSAQRSESTEPAANPSRVTPFPESPPWEGLNIPEGFGLTGQGVYRLGQRKEQLICGPLWARAKTRDISGKGWGLQVCWIDHDGIQQECAFPSRQLHERTQSPVIRHLADEGLMIIPGQESQLLTYLGSIDTPERINSTAQTGWVVAPGAPLTYVLPHAVLSTDEHMPLVFQPERLSPSADTLHACGSLKQWQAQVAQHCQGNPVLMFAAISALAPPLLHLAEMDSFGIHLYGQSSQGKTTALQVGSSVWGNGADPAASAESSIQRWNTTANALEGLAAAHNDGLLTLDEMGTFTGPDFGAVVYNLMGGQGKARMTDRGGIRAPRTWRLVALSTGEISIQAKIEECGGQVKAGQTNRFLDIPVSGRIIQQSQGLPPGKLADSIKEACGRCYGTLGPAFVDSLVQSAASVPALQQRVKQLVARHTGRLLGTADLESHQTRGLKRFGLICAAADLAAEAGLLPWQHKECVNAITDAAYQWLAANASEATRGILAVRSFILKNQDSKFRRGEPESFARPPVIHDIAGYYLDDKHLYAFTPDGFKRACGGLDPKAVAATLDAKGLLFKNDASRLQARLPIPGTSDRLRLYAVSAEILDAELAGGE